jgi:Ca2+-binding RTX toxin-like protein
MNHGMIESLENRKLMSITWVNNELTAVGSGTDESYYYASAAASQSSTNWYFVIANRLTGNWIESLPLGTYPNGSPPVINKTTITANGGNDVINSAINGPMEVHGGDGNDTIWANGANCSLYGDAGNDSLIGSVGNDILDGGSGTDTAHGGGGTDTFVSDEVIN